MIILQQKPEKRSLERKIGDEQDVEMFTIIKTEIKTEVRNINPNDANIKIRAWD